MARKRYSRKFIVKKIQNCCTICGETNYKLLDAHRIVEQGPYIPSNIVVLCANDHRRTHAGEIKFDRKYQTICGKTMLHYWINDEEFWKEVKI